MALTGIMKKVLLCSALAAALSGCSTYTPQRYSLAADANVALRPLPMERLWRSASTTSSRAASTLGWSGLIGRIVRYMPLPIVMRMVAGMFLPLVAGCLAAWATGAIAPVAAGAHLIVRPTPHVPAFSLQALVELVVPLAVTVLAIQNAQGFTVEQQAGHQPPVKAVTIGWGPGTLLLALAGSAPACLAGPTNGTLVSSGVRHRGWIGGVMFAVLMISFGLLAPVATRLALALPLPVNALVGGLAIFQVLQGAFQTAFRGECAVGAFVGPWLGCPSSTLVPSLGLMFAFAASRLLERDSLCRATVTNE
jgi:benzoate membrane transport protein